MLYAYFVHVHVCVCVFRSAPSRIGDVYSVGRGTCYQNSVVSLYQPCKGLVNKTRGVGTEVGGTGMVSRLG